MSPFTILTIVLEVAWTAITIKLTAITLYLQNPHARSPISFSRYTISSNPFFSITSKVYCYITHVSYQITSWGKKSNTIQSFPKKVIAHVLIKKNNKYIFLYWVKLYLIKYYTERQINFGLACINISFQDIHKLQIIMYSILFQNNVSPNCEKLIIKLHGGPWKKNISNLVMLPPKPLPILYTSFMNLNIITS